MGGEMLPCTTKLADVPFKPAGIILSGSPYSVYDEDAPRVDPTIFDESINKVPVLGICYGLQEMSRHFGATVESANHREYGKAVVNVVRDHSSDAENAGTEIGTHVDLLFEGVEGDLPVWMSHSDIVKALPAGFVKIATTPSAPFAAVAHASRKYYGIQFHPEVTHSPRGREIFDRFTNICGVKRDWKMETFIDKEIERIRKLVGPTGQVIGAVSGGVDSSVAAKLMHEAIGDRFHAIMVDNGVLRLNEAEQVHKMLCEDLGVNLTVVDASELFLGKLKGVEDPETKRKIIGNTFIEVFEQKAAELEADIEKSGAKGGKIEWLLQGTLYPDVIESISFKGPSATIKTHHNVGGLLEDMKLKLIEPLRELFKDEVRALGRLLKIPNHLVMRHPFPGPGLAIRILGEITPDQVRIAQHADAIFIEEIRKAGIYDQMSQAFCALLPVKAVGVQGDRRTYEQVICVRAVKTEDFMTAEWFDFPPAVLRKLSNRITNEVNGINRVVMDITSKPPGTIEWL